MKEKNNMCMHHTHHTTVTSLWWAYCGYWWAAVVGVYMMILLGVIHSSHYPYLYCLLSLDYPCYCLQNDGCSHSPRLQASGSLETGSPQLQQSIISVKLSAESRWEVVNLTWYSLPANTAIRMATDKSIKPMPQQIHRLHDCDRLLSFVTYNFSPLKHKLDSNYTEHIYFPILSNSRHQYV